MDFYVGQRVVCVDASNLESITKFATDNLVKDQIYTVDKLHTCSGPLRVGVKGIYYNDRAVTINCVVCKAPEIPGTAYLFLATRFAPIIESKNEFKEVTFTKVVESQPIAAN